MPPGGPGARLIHTLTSVASALFFSMVFELWLALSSMEFIARIWSFWR